MIQKLYETLCNINGTEQVLRDEPMSRHTTFRIGGPAALFCIPRSVPALAATVKACIEADIPYYILGNGSNVLVSDAGYQGVVIQLFRNMDGIRIRGTEMEVEAGALLVKIAHTAAKESLTGLEFASGIPGTLGGGLTMNAGAYGGEMKDVVKEAVVMKPDGEILRLTKEELELGYRTSVIARKGYLVISALLKLKEGEAEVIRARMQELKEARISKQPLEYASAGSTFKRPEGYFAGKLIMDAGLRGFTVGGAQVSEKHCGFVINRGGATAQNVMDLVRQVQNEVKKQFGVDLELEVKLLGFADR
ncbi:UDP-N-acetylmuramate dehydrogenase [Anaerosacchariphilus sp. NSJ-68]|uniref:UDP-N-acetylenolpyruvoylglucosamine reductase n=2 Tax=Lachnospiraceae TaxID=186803 RepID=A0A923RKR7_9FIRM|nr:MULTISPECIES: UDP-N-acetylmuramate dehydrogenase [Lachnospiraceae]MBC5658492.1 UDP-N-acetylmuramate dehydrogenase [Anaerosacchariphilus hominis]MBC5698299.1 UDP-N-acetylmuramate dehydrogenase [Roseburia difficilis]